jgi:hypothetical protein
LAKSKTNSRLRKVPTKTAKPKKAAAKKATAVKHGKPAAKTAAEISRENGKEGGRPRKPKNLEEFNVVAAPPIGQPLELIRWVQGVLSIDLYRMIRGKNDDRLSSAIRNTGRAIVSSLPMDIIAEAKRLIEAERDLLDSDASPETVSAESLEDEDGATKPTRSISG